MNLYDKIVALEKEVLELKRELLHLKGQPIIQGYSGQRLDIDRTAKISDILKRIETLESA